MSQTELVTADVLGAGLDQVNNATAAPTAGTLAKRDANGRLQATSPAVPGDVATKGYVDARPTGGGGSTGDAAATPSTLVLRDAAGRAKVVDPAVAGDAATKGYVDGRAGAANGVAALDGSSGLILPTYAEITQYAAGQAPAAPAMGKTRLYVDSNGLLQLLPAAGGARRIAAHWGSGTVFPAGVAAGDTFIRSDIGTNGTLYQYAGNASTGSGGWITEGPVVCTSTTRPVAGLYASLLIYETDTKATLAYDGANWYVAGAMPWIGSVQTSWAVGTTSAQPSYPSFTTVTGSNAAGLAGANPTRILPCSGAGFYDLTVAIDWPGTSSGGSRGWGYRINGGTFMYQHQQTGLGSNYGTNLMGTTPGLQLAATDYVEVGFWQDSGVTLTVLPNMIRVSLRRAL